ncbi:Rve domain containing hypothetical protein [Phytophthora palmivora]|uniref:Integrase catalytic domain-containing protein n=1 Tax=Phytophthora palmivora TaxID=4796 RepID=A0A2P4YE04_9STRA|nr:Rve domain containing hypothetical protein [Phytophthora palmivora]
MSGEFQSKSCIIWDKSRAIASGKKISKAYVLDCQENTANYTEYSMVSSKWELWHAHMEPLNEASLARNRQTTHGIPTTQQKFEKLCGGSMKGKQTVAKFPSQSLTRTRCPLDLAHTDVMGPMKTKSKGGARYVLTFVDDYSRFVVAYFLTMKSEVSSNFESFVKLYENQWGRRIKYLRSDNGTEFSNKAMDKICETNGSLHQKTVPYSPSKTAWQNE